jgi:hypothetical protein
MDIRIGIHHAPRELAFDTDVSVTDVEERFAAALASNGLVRINDSKGQEYIIPAASIAYIEFGAADLAQFGRELIQQSLEAPPMIEGPLAAQRDGGPIVAAGDPVTWRNQCL